MRLSASLAQGKEGSTAEERKERAENGKVKMENGEKSQFVAQSRGGAEGTE